MTAHQKYQAAAKDHGQHGQEDGGHHAPDHQSVPFPSPDFMQKANGMSAEVLDLTAAEREAVGVKEEDAELHEREKQQQVDWRDRVCADLGGSLIQPEDPCDQDDYDCGQSHGGVDADDDPQGEAPCQPARRDAATQLAQ